MEVAICQDCGLVLSTEDADMWCPCGGDWGYSGLLTLTGFNLEGSTPGEVPTRTITITCTPEDQK